MQFVQPKFTGNMNNNTACASNLGKHWWICLFQWK